MPDEQPTRDARIIEPDVIAADIFRILLEQHPALVPIDELIREFKFPPDVHRDTPSIFITEAVERLYHDGLAHRVDGFAFASRAGVRALELWT